MELTKQATIDFEITEYLFMCTKKSVILREFLMKCLYIIDDRKFSYDYTVLYKRAYYI